MPRPIKASEFDQDLTSFLRQYKYQPRLTRKLDGLDDVNFTPELLNEIVLWKVNRYVALDGDHLRRIDALRKLKPGEHGEAQSVLEELLAAHGVDLPMASTILRFRNPAVFQIIDRHAYRALYGMDYPLHTQSSVKRKIEVYFAYLDDLRLLCKIKGLKFESVDRVLYVFDKETNGGLAKSKEP
jgi:thermostable 8-oxoguanine DNA glycosylase